MKVNSTPFCHIYKQVSDCQHISRSLILENYFADHFYSVGYSIYSDSSSHQNGSGNDFGA